jgi:hypothetical protein
VAQNDLKTQGAAREPVGPSYRPCSIKLLKVWH